LFSVFLCRLHAAAIETKSHIIVWRGEEGGVTSDEQGRTWTNADERIPGKDSMTWQFL